MFVVAFCALAGCGDSPDDFAYQEIKIDLTIGAERGTFTGLLECHRTRQWLSIDGPSNRWVQSGGAVVGEFPSGHAFVLVLGQKGQLCGTLRLPGQIHPYVYTPVEDRINDPAKVEYRGFGIGAGRWGLFVFDNVRDPKTGRFYIGPDYFRQPGGDAIEVHSITTRRSTKLDKAEWRAHWEAGGTHLGWLDRFTQGDQEALFGGFFVGFERLGPDRRARYSEAIDAAARTADPAARWLQIKRGNHFLSAPNYPLYATTQEPERLLVDRQAPAPLWWTTVYLLPKAIYMASCAGLHPDANLARGLRLWVDGADTGTVLSQNLLPKKDPRDVVQDQSNTAAFDRDDGVLVLGVNEFACLDVRQLQR